MKFRREPRRGEKIIAQGKRVSAPPWAIIFSPFGAFIRISFS
jgi:hypothetical protein